jgi:serine/threonine protein kinase
MSHFEKIDSNDLQEGRLLSTEQIEMAKQFFRDNPDRVKWSRKLNNQTTFSVLRSEDGQMFALYTGKEKALGKGVFGSVKLAQNLETGEWVAIKLQKLEANQDTQKRQEEIRRENEFLERRRLFINSQVRTAEGFANKETHYSIMPIIEGRACDKIQAKIEDTFYGLIDADFSVKQTQQEMLALSSFLVTLGLNIAEQLSEIHADDIIHRDLRLANILATPEGQVTITDFGTALELDPKTKTVTAQIAGERQTRPPEVIAASLQVKGNVFTYSKQQDLFSLGKCLDSLKIISLINEKNFQDLIGISVEEGKHITQTLKSLLFPLREEAPPRASAEDVARVLSVIQQKISQKIAENPDATEETDAFQTIEKLRENLPTISERDSYGDDDSSSDYDSSPGSAAP